MANKSKPDWKNKKRNFSKSESKPTDDKSFKSDSSNRMERFDSTKVGMNDASWYAENSFLLRDSASYSFNNPLGNRIELGTAEAPITGTMSIPGVFTMYTMPAFGISSDNSSPINIAARNIYSFVRHANSGHSNYDSPDLMVYLMAMDSLYSYYAFLVRAYGVMRSYSQKNRYLPQSIIEGMGLNFFDLQANLADFRYYINVCAVKIGSLCAPKSMSYFTRHMWMYTNIYSDGPGAKAAVYQYSPLTFYKFSATAETTGGSLQPVDITTYTASTLMTFAQIQTQLNSMIAAVIEDEDMNIMSGDILKAFGDDGVFKLTSIPEDYLVTPVFNLEVLGQIQNTTLVGRPFMTGRGLTQNPVGALLFSPEFMSDIKGQATNRLFNAYSDSPTPDEVMVNSRLTLIGGAGDGAQYSLDSAASDIACFARLIKFIDEGGSWHPVAIAYAQKFQYAEKVTITEDVQGLVTLMSDLEKFDMHPYILKFYDGTSSDEIWGIFGDVENYTILNKYDLRKLHETALLSMLNVPQMGAFAKKA